MAGTFDFALNSRVITEVPPEEKPFVSMNGWDFTAKPSTPYRAKFRVRLYGMRWYLNAGGTALDITTEPTLNAGRLRQFYKDNRLWDNFTFAHEYLGNLTCRFAEAFEIPPAIGNSRGLIEPFDVLLIHHNPGY